MREPRYSQDEFARRGKAIYEKIRPLVEPDRDGEIVAIDIESGDWEVDPEILAACHQLEQRRPDSQTWVMRVGSPTVLRFGAGRTRSSVA